MFKNITGNLMTIVISFIQTVDGFAALRKKFVQITDRRVMLRGFLLSLKREGTRRVTHEISGKSRSPNWPNAMGDERRLWNKKGEIPSNSPWMVN